MSIISQNFGFHLHAQFSILRRPKPNNQLLSIGINYYWRESDRRMPLLAQNGMSAISSKLSLLTAKSPKNRMIDC